MLIRLLLIFFALLPGALLAGFFMSYFRRRLGSELAGIAIGLGIISAFLVLAAVWILRLLPDDTLPALPALGGYGEAFLTAGLPEETVKFLLLMTIIRRHEDCDSGGDLFCSAVLIGLGFAAVENVMYLAFNGDNWFSLGLLRGALAVPGHATFGILMGHCAAQAWRLSASFRQWLVWLALAWMAPVALHTLYDFPLMALSSDQSDQMLDLTDRLAYQEIVILVIAAVMAWLIARREMVAIYRNRLDHDLELPPAGALRPWRVLGWVMILGALGCFSLAVWLMMSGEDAALLFMPSIFPLTFGCIMQLRPPKDLMVAGSPA